MSELKLWESKLNEFCLYLNSIDEFINYLKQNNTTSFNIVDTYTQEKEQRTILDQMAQNQNINLTYTDHEHNAVIIDLDINKPIIINPFFYQENKEKIIEYLKEITLQKIKSKPLFISIPNMLLTDEFIDILVNSEELKETNIYIDNITDKKLTQEQIQKIRKHHLEVFMDNKTISTNKLIDYYTLSMLKDLTTLHVKKSITEREIENFIYLEQNCQIKIEPNNQNDELEYINFLKKIFNMLKKHDRKYNITIKINNRELLKQSGILNINNINLTIHNDLYDYKKDEYLKEEEQLDKLIAPIKNADLSPYEKYLAVYNLVKQFKPYKENKDDKDQSRFLRYILNNDYMVCVGYSILLKTLLDKVGIPCIEASVKIDTSYDKGFTQEEIPTNLTGHARNIIKIDDPKYNVHGIYIADATWDNDMKLDLYNNASITFDRKKEAKRLEGLSANDLLLDFHSFEEFNEKLNYYLIQQQRIIKKNSVQYNQTDTIEATYQKAYTDILTILSQLDYPKYQELYNKYNKQITEYTTNFRQLEQIYSDFFTEYAKYILPLSNKEIPKETLLQAAINTKKALNRYKRWQLIKMKKSISSTYETQESIFFPYQYDPTHPTPNYLEAKNIAKK